jgi:hypothetical protein
MSDKNKNEQFSWRIYVGAEIPSVYYGFCGAEDIYHDYNYGVLSELHERFFCEDDIIKNCNVKYPQALDLRVRDFIPFCEIIEDEKLDHQEALEQDNVDEDLSGFFKERDLWDAKVEDFSIVEQFPVNRHIESGVFSCHFPEISQVIRITSKQSTIDKLRNNINDNNNIYFILKGELGGNKEWLYFMDKEMENFLKNPWGPPQFIAEDFNFFELGFKAENSPIDIFSSPKNIETYKDLDDEIPF